MSSTTRFSDKFLVRLPHGMRDQLAEAARENGRTMTAEIAHRLQASFGSAQFEKDCVVLRLAITPGMKIEEVLELLAAAQMALPDGARVVVS
ncbi:Arc family DNA-binding protein [Aquabacterium sp.]|uniref:Arc family DNA-binding protein n=1 Tax=Aquabacterium sp. TaxID=1872578 RepID=UPI0025C1F62F|nr:Arc family DNA-binding protein [Aquabacterium sp.]